MRKLGKIKINIKEPTPTAAERLHQSQQAIRKTKGLPDPSHYKQMAAQKKAEIDSMKEEKQTELKPRNFVAKNAKTAGAGKHKDIRKMLKDIRGQKHKAKMEEEVEQLDEISKGTLANYTSSAAVDLAKRSLSVGQKSGKGAWSDDPEHRKYDITKDKDKDKMVKRVSGITKASMRLAKEEVELLDEMPESSMKTRDVHAHLKSKGWAIARTSGGHDIYKHPKAKNVIAVPRHKQLKAPLIKGILKSSQVSEEVVKESFRIGGMGSGGGGRGNIYQYDRNPPPKDGSELENIPSRPKTELQKRLKTALTDLGDKLKQTHPKLKEALGDDITVFKKGSNVKQKIKASSYGTFKQHGFRKVAEAKDSQEYDYEGDMAKSDLRSIMHHAKELHDMIDDNTNLAEWCQSKITLAEDYLSTVANYMRSEMNEGAVPSKEETTKVRHHKSGKELVVTKRSVERYKQQGYHPVKEEVELDEGRASQRHPLEGHEYHKKSNEALVHIAKDAHAAAEAMKGHNPDSENKYRDQANDSATVRHFRQKNGMPDWYKKKYGHVNEEVEQIDELSNKTLHSYVHKSTPQAHLRAKGINKALTKSMYKAMAPKSKSVKEEVEIIDEDENDYRRKIEKNNKNFIAASKRQQNPLTNVHTAKEIEKRMQQKPVKESASEPTEGEMRGKQQGMSRRAQIVKDAAKGKKSDNSDKFQKDPELSSEIHKT